MNKSNYKDLDLKWIKNVKREGGNGWAYIEFNISQSFYLNWPRGRANMGYKNAESPEIGELILLFQTLNKSSGAKPGTYLTHIVTPVEHKVNIDNTSSHPFTRLVIVVAKAVVPIPKPIDLNFGQTARGWIYNLNLVKQKKGKLTLETKQQLLWALFTKKDIMLKGIINDAVNYGLEEKINGVIEGAERFTIGLHKVYERDLEIIRQKKKWARRNNCLLCEVCNLDFSKFYGSHGDGFIECHHKTPISAGGIRTTTLNDLALVCPNCHRMLHKKNQNNNYYGILELRKIVNDLRIDA